MVEKKRVRKTGPIKPEGLPTLEGIEKGRARILQRSRLRMQDPNADKGRIRSQALGQLYALTRDPVKRKEFRADISNL